MVLPLIGRFLARGIVAKSLDDDAIADVVNSVKIDVEQTPKDPTVFIKDLEARKLRNLKKALSVTSQTGINIILDRTAKGSGINEPFKSYTPAYENFRSESGRGVTPNLFFSGNMLGSMTSQVTKNEGIIFFTRREESAKASKNNKTRPFFGFSEKEKAKLSDVFRRYYLK